MGRLPAPRDRPSGGQRPAGPRIALVRLHVVPILAEAAPRLDAEPAEAPGGDRADHPANGRRIRL